MTDDDMEWTLNTCLTDVDYFIDRFQKRAAGPQGDRFGPPLERLSQLRSKIQYLAEQLEDRPARQTFRGVSSQLDSRLERSNDAPVAEGTMTREELNLRFNKLNLTVSALLDKLTEVPNSLENGFSELQSRMRLIEDRVETLFSHVNRLKFGFEKTQDDIESSRSELKTISQAVNRMETVGGGSNSDDSSSQALEQIADVTQDLNQVIRSQFQQLRLELNKPKTPDPEVLQALKLVNGQLNELLESERAREQRLTVLETQFSALRQYFTSIATSFADLPGSLHQSPNRDIQPLSEPETSSVAGAGLSDQFLQSVQPRTSHPGTDQQLTQAFSSQQGIGRSTSTAIALTPDEQAALDELQALSPEEQEDLESSEDNAVVGGQVIIDSHDATLHAVDSHEEKQLSDSNAADFSFTLDDIDI